MRVFSEFRSVFLRWLNDCLTTCLKNFSLQSSFFLSFLFNRITPDFTFGAGSKTSLYLKWDNIDLELIFSSNSILIF